jgi:hypothetical protein
MYSKTTASLALVSIGFLLTSEKLLPAQPDIADVDLKVIRIGELETAIKSHRGKVVIVYMWGDYSAPDVKVLTDVAKMQKRMAKEPIVFMTLCHSPVHRDDPKLYEKKRASNLEVLKRSKAQFQNFVLDEKDEVWESKLGFASGPTFNVYEQSGKMVRTFSLGNDLFRIADVEKLARELGRAKSSK